jgi:hypothetical protein
LPALAYTDNDSSYASNEICINWNAPLAFLAVGLEALVSPNGLPTGVTNDHGKPEAPHEYGLMQNYPNPFNPTTTIEYVIPYESLAVLKVYNLLGQEMRTLYEGWASPGQHKVSFDTSDLPSGIYVYRLTAGGGALSKKMILAK